MLAALPWFPKPWFPKLIIPTRSTLIYRVGTPSLHLCTEISVSTQEKWTTSKALENQAKNTYLMDEGEEKFYWGKKKFTDHNYLVSIIMEER